MNTEELELILRKGEDKQVEFKQCREKVPGNFYTTVVSFLNREGGVIVLGVDDEGVIYDREFDSDIAITDDTRISELYFRKRNTFSESEILPHLRFEDFNEHLFRKTRALVGAINGTHPWIESDDITILRDCQFYRRDPRTGEEGYTLASALVFGKDEVIRSILPAYKADVLVRIRNLDRYDDRLPSLRTNLIDTYQAIMEFLKAKLYLPEQFYLEGDQRKDLRELIFRELVGNMIVHREYTSAHPTSMVIFDNRVEISNPNKPLFKGILSLNAYSPFAKNPTIRKFFSELGWSDELGSGIKNVKKYLKIYANGAQPVFIEDDLFRVIIPLSCPVFGKKAESILLFLGFDLSEIPTSILDNLKNLPLFQKFTDINEIEPFLFQKGSSWIEKGVKLKNCRINKINDIDFLEFQKGSSISEKGRKYFPKRMLQILKLLIICITPVKTEDILHLLTFGSRDKLRELYLKPLREDGVLEPLIKDKPNSPEQKFVLTEKGRLFLGGFDIE